MEAGDTCSQIHEPAILQIDMEAMRRFGQWWEAYVKKLNDPEAPDQEDDRGAS